MEALFTSEELFCGEATNGSVEDLDDVKGEKSALAAAAEAVYSNFKSMPNCWHFL